MKEYRYFSGNRTHVIIKPEYVLYYLLPKYILYLQMPEDLWIWCRRKYNNYNMALMMIDILHEKKLINDTTYKNINKKNTNINENKKGRIA